MRGSSSACRFSTGRGESRVMTKGGFRKTFDRLEALRPCLGDSLPPCVLPQAVAEPRRALRRPNDGPEVARNFSAVLDTVEREQEEIVLVRNRRQVARLVPKPPHQDALAVCGDLFRRLDDKTAEASTHALLFEESSHRRAMGLSASRISCNSMTLPSGSRP
jgi:antitoxin (DNA-binding transcriptional repressor) of toxin-antitoxin stability system